MNDGYWLTTVLNNSVIKTNPRNAGICFYNVVIGNDSQRYTKDDSLPAKHSVVDEAGT